MEPFNRERDNWRDYWDVIEQYFLANEIVDNKKRTATFLTLNGNVQSTRFIDDTREAVKQESRGTKQNITRPFTTRSP